MQGRTQRSCMAGRVSRQRKLIRRRALGLRLVGIVSAEHTLAATTRRSLLPRYSLAYRFMVKFDSITWLLSAQSGPLKEFALKRLPSLSAGTLARPLVFTALHVAEQAAVPDAPSATTSTPTAPIYTGARPQLPVPSSPLPRSKQPVVTQRS